MKLLVVVLNYRVTQLTIDCLRALSKEIASVPGAKVAICENGTGDDSAERIQRAIEENGWGEWCDLTVIHPNRGFTGGNNVIIRAALAWAIPPEYFLLLNADTIVQPRALSELVKFMDENCKVGVAGSQLLSPEHVVQASPFRFQGIATELDRGLRLGIVSKWLSRWAVVPPTPTSSCQADWVSGASMIIRRQVIEAIGPLDEDYYTYFDDIDYCLNAKRAGWSTCYVPASRVIHLEAASTGIAQKIVKRRPVYWFEARRRFFLKNYGAVYTALADLAFIIGFALWRIRRAIQRKADDDPPHLLWDAVCQSVFLKGFRVRPVQNPALREQPMSHAAGMTQT